MIKQLYILFVLIGLNSFSQVELAVQKGHSDDIVQLEFSNNSRYLASLAANNEIIIWEVGIEKALSSFKIGEIEIIEGLKFTDDEQKLKIKTFRTTYFYDIIKSKLTEQVLPADTLYRKKDYFFDSKTNSKLEIVKGAILKKKINKKFRLYKISVNYLEAPFTAFDVATDKNLLIGVAEDERIYICNYLLGVKYWVLKGHNSAINDIRFTKDGKYFATAGRDRSIIIWDAKTFKIKTRFLSHIYQKKTVTFSPDGGKIFIGDELGYIYEIGLNTAFPYINVTQNNFHSINKIKPFDGGYYIVSADNHVYYKNNIFDKKPQHKYAFRDHTLLKSKDLLLEKAFKVYQPPFGETALFDISPDTNLIVYSGRSDIPTIAVAKVGKIKINHLYHPYDNRQWTDVEFVSNNEIIAIHDSSNVLYGWKIDKHKTYLKTDTLPFIIKNFKHINGDEIWINSRFYGQFIYNIRSRKLNNVLKITVENVFKHNQYIVLATASNSIVFYDLVKKEKYHFFMGHSGVVTDINFHPNNDLFISSSDDGAVKMWSFKQKKLLVTIFPFKNKEFIFITSEKDYLITKGGMEEIGFKYNGQYFYPEQFDLKYNRPDKVLKLLGYSDSLLIEAYHKAYLKRLKKMNFTEDQLSSDFHLPVVEISNFMSIPSQTDKKYIDLNLNLTDSKYKLDRINIWVNDVAIYGVNGISLRQIDKKSIQKQLKVNLAQGDNKIQVSVLNQTGAESYKKIIEINSTVATERPNLFTVTIGVSKHKDTKYNLDYAHKDAIDIASAFQENTYFKSVQNLTLTDEDVTLENLAKVKTFVNKANINDVVLIFVAGHGVLDDNFNYYFASYDMDFKNPSERGIPYETIEQFLDGIRALKKMLLIDTCHSGELDKDEIEENTNEKETEQGDIIFRSAGIAVKAKDNPLGLKSTNELMKSLFTDFRKGTGATVISSSGGVELSLESGEFKNGLFTYCLLKGLLKKEADLNKDKQISVSELQKYVSSEVNLLSNGTQTPTSRIQNNELDYRVW